VSTATRPISTCDKLDVDGAKKLLAAAGYGDGFEVQLNCPNNRYVTTRRSAWPSSRCGQGRVKASLVAENMAPSSRRCRTSTRRVLLGWASHLRCAVHAAVADPHPHDGADGSFNFSRISDPVVDRLTER